MKHRLQSSSFRIIWVGLALLLILALGSVLRFHELGEESLWNDELESWRQSSFASVASVIEDGVRPDTHPPGFQVVLYLVENTFGSREADLRLPSAISGILTILVVFLLGSRFFGDREGLMAALFMSVMWAPIYYSQEARNYALVTFLAAGASYFWMEMVSRVGRGRRIGVSLMLLYVASASATAYTHYFGLLLVVLQSAFLVPVAASKRGLLLSVLLAYGLVLLSYVPWIPSMLEQTTHTSRISWIQAPAITAFPAFISFAFNRLRWLGAPVLLFYGWLLWTHIQEVRSSDKIPFASFLTSPDGLTIYWLVAPMVVTFLVSILWTPIFTQRNLLLCLPAVYLLLARAIARLPLHSFGKAAIALGISGVALFNLIYTQGYYRLDQKEQYREVVRHVVEQQGESRDPLIVGYSRFAEYFDYYFQRYSSDLRIELVAGEMADIARLRGELERQRPKQIWFLSAHRMPDEAFLEALTEDYSVIEHKVFIRAEVRLLTRDVP